MGKGKRTRASNEQIRAAQVETREMLQNMLPGSKPTTGPGPDWVNQLLDSLLTSDTPRCVHLERRPVQPAVTAVWERYWRCRPCTAARATKEHEQIEAGTYQGAGDIEEGTCDRCRTYVGGSKLTPVVLRIDIWVVLAAVCPPCFTWCHAHGAELWDSTGRE